MFPPRETMICRAVLPDEVYQSEEHSAETIEGKGLDDEVEVRNVGEKSWKQEKDELRIV